MIGEGLSPYFTRVITHDLVKSGLQFAVHFDETTTTEVKRQMDLTLRYWSSTLNKVWKLTGFLKMYEQIHHDGLPVDKMATLVRDGQNVNKTIFQKKMNELISQDYTKFQGPIDIGSCTMHTVHNAFGQGIEQYGKDIDQLCLDLHLLFKCSAARCEDFKEVQIEMEVDTHNFQQHTEVWWLSMEPSIKSILEQWEAITHFLTALDKDMKKVLQSINYERVYMMLGTKKKVVTKVTLKFFNNVIPVFGKFMLLFQMRYPAVHILYDSLCDIFKKCMRFLKLQAIESKYESEYASVECRNVKLQLADKEILIREST